MGLQLIYLFEMYIYIQEMGLFRGGAPKKG